MLTETTRELDLAKKEVRQEESDDSLLDAEDVEEKTERAEQDGRPHIDASALSDRIPLFGHENRERDRRKGQQAVCSWRESRQRPNERRIMSKQEQKRRKTLTDDGDNLRFGPVLVLKAAGKVLWLAALAHHHVWRAPNTIPHVPSTHDGDRRECGNLDEDPESARGIELGRGEAGQHDNEKRRERHGNQGGRQGKLPRERCAVRDVDTNLLGQLCGHVAALKAKPVEVVLHRLGIGPKTVLARRGRKVQEHGRIGQPKLKRRSVMTCQSCFFRRNENKKVRHPLSPAGRFLCHP